MFTVLKPSSFLSSHHHGLVEDWTNVTFDPSACVLPDCEVGGAEKKQKLCHKKGEGLNIKEEWEIKSRRREEWNRFKITGETQVDQQLFGMTVSHCSLVGLCLPAPNPRLSWEHCEKLLNWRLVDCKGKCKRRPRQRGVVQVTWHGAWVRNAFTC